MRRFVTPEMAEEMRAKVRAGVSRPTIARATGFYLSTVLRHTAGVKRGGLSYEQIVAAHGMRVRAERYARFAALANAAIAEARP